MSKFQYTTTGCVSGLGFEIYDVKHAPSTKIIGQVSRSVSGWQLWAPHASIPEPGYPTRQAAAERLLLVSGVNPVAWSALPADPFEGVSA